MYNSIYDAVLDNSNKNPDRIAIVDENNQCTYGQLIEYVKRVSYWLRQNGIGYNSRLLVECTQDIPYLVIALACENAGIVFVPIEKKASENRVQDILNETETVYCIMRNKTSIQKCIDMNIVIETMMKPTYVDEFKYDINSVSEILFSTGTTGKAKGIVISNLANVAIAENIISGVKMDEHTVEIVPLPLSHSHGLRTCYANLLNGSTVVIMDGILNIGLFFQLLERYNVNSLDISPTIAELLIKIARNGLEQYSDKINYIQIGTSTLSEELKHTLRQVFPHSRLYNFYGSTEAGRSCVFDFSKDFSIKCIGYPTCNSHFLIVDDNQKVMESSPEHIGYIAVEGKMMMDGYLNDPSLTKKTLRNGILYTSDLGYIGTDGKLFLFGRGDDVINYKGIKIAPEEIENIAMKYECVKDCACVAEEDKTCGQIPKLFVSLVDEERYLETELRTILQSELEKNRIPNKIIIVQEIPRSSNGKLVRRLLKEKK